MKKSFDKNFFDEEFYLSKQKDAHGDGVKGAKRDKLSWNMCEFSSKVDRCLANTGCKSILDIGGGIGVRTELYVKKEYDAYVCDISEWACQNSLMKDRHYCKDIRNIGEIGKKFDVIITERIIEYLPTEYAIDAMKSVYDNVDKYAFFSIVCSDHRDPNIPLLGAPGRMNINKKSYWENLFSKFKWSIDKEKVDIMLENDWDCIWVLKK